jgi:Zn-dependent peptidase ImmA (M78 family)
LRHVDFPEITIPDLQFPADPTAITDDMIEKAAEAMRQHWCLGDSVIANMVMLLENNGVVSSRFELDSDKLDSFSVWDTLTNRPLLVLGADKKSACRSRFDAAHELGHLVLHRRIPKALLQHTPSLATIEDQAHRFARAFLLPATSFGADLILPTLLHLKNIKPKWKASIAFMIKRAEELQLFTADESRRLWIGMTRHGWKRREPFDDEMKPERPVLLARSLQLMIESNTVSRDGLETAIPFLLDEVEALTFLPHGYLTAPAPSSQDPEPRLLPFPA